MGNVTHSPFDKSVNLCYNRPMIIYYTTEECNSGEFLKRALGIAGATSEILRTKNGKPYLKKGELQFSLTHTEGLTAVAVGAQQVGLAAEKRKPRKLDSLLSRLTPEEQDEDFYALWTAKESYVKYLGGTLAECLPALTYKKGVLYRKDAPLDVCLKHFEIGDVALCLCTKNEENFTLMRLF